ncbi:GshAB [Acrasis kona]|uniref:GshAB n=1 Tax=Acrasis kona TaxID=1008807 RepID=A0AAW2ZGJ3_9EUKA
MRTETVPTIYVIHENDDWMVPLRSAFKTIGVNFVEWHFGNGDTFDFSSIPPQGVFYNRMSASSHTRSHRYAAEHTHAVLEWLELNQRRVVNNSRALALETAVGSYDNAKHETSKSKITKQAQSIFGGDKPFITKHNRSGKGLGVHLFKDVKDLESYLDSDAITVTDEERPVDGVLLLQEYITAPKPEINRAEFINGELTYIVTIDTSNGFELCPADQCQIRTKPMFVIRKNDQFLEDEQVLATKIKKFLIENGIEIAGVEYIRDSQTNELLVYDVNTNTNYNPSAEKVAGEANMMKIAKFLKSELDLLSVEDVEAD